LNSDIQRKELILFGLYDPWNWKKLYKEYFDTFEKIILIFCGTDILQICGEYFQYSLKKSRGYTEVEKNELLSYLKNSKNIIFAAENEYIKHEVKELHDIDCNVIAIPSKHNLSIEYFQPPKIFKKIAVYMPTIEHDWYNYNIIIDVLKKMPDIEFYFYKKGGFIPRDEHKNIPNLIACDEVKNMKEFMRDKFCSLRITLHDGEPITGAETIVLNRHFIFNHPMKYATKCELNADSIINNINKLINNCNFNNNEAIEYYYKKYKFSNFERNMKIFFNIAGLDEIYNSKNSKYFTNQNVEVKNTNEFYINYLQIKSKQKGSSPGIYFNLNVEKGKIYYLTYSGYTKVDHNIFFRNKVDILEDHYSKLNIFYGPAQIKFKALTDAPHIVMVLFNTPNINDEIYFEKLLIHSV